MRLLTAGDLHLTDKQPEKRLDNYPEVQRNKMEFILQTYQDYKCDCLIQPGDFFDYWKVSEYLKAEYLRLLHLYNDPQIFTIYGQHDLKFHSANHDDTHLRVMKNANAIDILHNGITEFGTLILYGSSWGEPIPDYKSKSNYKHILVTHRMVIKNKKVWQGQEEYDTALTLLKKTKFDYIITGDNHQSFTCDYQGRKLINCGSLMRSNIGQSEHRPSIWIIDTNTGDEEQIFIPIVPFNEVFDVAKDKEEKKVNKNLDLYTKELGKIVNKPKKLSFVINLQKRLKDPAIKKPERAIIDEVMEGVKV